MITLRRAKERHHGRSRKQEVWRTFHPRDRADALADGFGALEALDEDHLPPGASIPRHRHRDGENVTYVRAGALVHEDSMGRSGVIHAGEFQCTAGGRGIRHTERNASQAESSHVFQIWFHPSEVGLEPGQAQKRFSAAERKGRLCVVASPDARSGSLGIHQDALVYSALLDPGQHVAHEISPGRRVWLHLVQGKATLDDITLSTGDGAGVATERAVSLTACEETEILLVDLGRPPPPAGRDDGTG